MDGLARRTTIAGLFALAFVHGGAARTHAQAALLGPGAAYISGGIARIATSDLDDRLQAGGYPTFGQTGTMLGIGAYRRLSNDVMLGFEGNGLIVGEKDYAGGEVGIGGGYATLGLGYAIQLSRRARVYPRIGLGAGGMGVWFDSEADTVPFDDVLANPAPGPDTEEPLLSIDGVVIDAGGGAEFTPVRRGSGLLVGLRFGYLFAPFDTSWQLIRGGNSSVVTGGPEANMSGFYIRLLVGGAWRR